MSNSETRKWVGFGLDGCLSELVESMDVIGKPIPEMIDKIKEVINDNVKVKIVTSRVHPSRNEKDDMVALISSWCLENIGTIIEITHEIDPYMDVLLHAAVMQVIPNTGKTVLDSINGLMNGFIYHFMNSYNIMNVVQKEAIVTHLMEENDPLAIMLKGVITQIELTERSNNEYRN